MARLGRPRKAETDVKTGKQSGLMANYEGVMSLDTILKDNLGFLPKEARDEVGKKVSGLKIAGKVYARVGDVEKALDQFWHEAEAEGETVTPILTADEGGRVQVPSVDCESCEELKEARARAANADQKLKLQETTYKAQFNTLTNQLTASRNEKSALQKEKAELEQEKGRLTRQIDSMSKQIHELSKQVEKPTGTVSKSELDKLKKDLENTKKALSDAVEKEKKVQGELVKANARIKELEASHASGNKGESSSKAKMKDQMREYEKTIKMNGEIIQKLTRDREAARNELEELKASANTKTIEKLLQEKNDYKELFETATNETDEKKKKIDELEATLRTVRAELNNAKAVNESLQAALDERPSSAGIEVEGIKRADLFYADELTDLLQILAERNVIRLEGVQDTYKREYDLSKMAAGALKNSGWQDKMREKLDKAAESGDIRQYYRIGFEDAEGGKHDKLYYHGDARYTAVLSVTPSDIRSAQNAASGHKNMLCIAPAKAE